MELLTHHPGGGHGDVEASGVVFLLRQDARTGTTISSRDQNCDADGTEVDFEKTIPSHEVSGRRINKGQRGSQEVTHTPQAARWRDKGRGHATRAPWPLVGPLRWFFVPSGVFWIKRFSGFFLEFFEHL